MKDGQEPLKDMMRRKQTRREEKKINGQGCYGLQIILYGKSPLNAGQKHFQEQCEQDTPLIDVI